MNYSNKDLALKIGWFYPRELNLYGDQGNIEILSFRTENRGFSAKITLLDLNTPLNSSLMKDFNLVFMGGGPDLEQQKVYPDFVQKKGPYLREYLESGGVGLFVCGAYQLLGKYYKASDGSSMEGLNLLDFYTESPKLKEVFGRKKSPKRKIPRIVGNTVVRLNSELLEKPAFLANNNLGEFLVGFENHAGRTFLSQNASPLGFVSLKSGNNGQDLTEGIFYKNTIGTYLHGPVLARNPHLADFLIASALGLDKLPVSGALSKLDSLLITSAHERSKKLKR